MGLSDRDYARDEPRGIFLGGDRSMTVNLILLNVGIFLVGTIFFPAERRREREPNDHRGIQQKLNEVEKKLDEVEKPAPDALSQMLSLKADLFQRPWQFW